MHRSTITIATTFVALALACSSSSTGSGTAADGGADGGTTSTGDGGKTLGGSIHPPAQTGNAIVDRLGAAAAACGKQSSFTVPGGWEMVAVGEKGCVTWAPPGWIISGSFTGIVTAMKDGSGQEGFLGVAGATTASCSPAPIRDSVLDGYTAKGYSTPEVLWHAELNDEFGGTFWPTGHAVFSTSLGGTPLIGYLWVLTTQTVVACDVVGLGFWEPVASIETDTCTLTQIINSVKCGGASCDDSDCNTVCRNDGKAGGSCGTSSSCECY